MTQQWIAAGLARTSTIMQVETGLSMITQPERIKDYAARNGIRIVHIYEEPGVSGRKAQRKVVERIMRDARAGKFNLLIVTDVSRFFRNLEALISAIRELKSYEVDFLSIDDGIDTRRKDSWGNELIMVILGMLAELYTVQLAHNTREGKYRRFKLGLWNGSIPFGYCNGLCSQCTHPNGQGYCPRFGGPDLGDGKNLILHPIESEGVRLAFELYATGDYSDNDVAQTLADHVFRLPDGDVRRFRVPRKRLRKGEEKQASKEGPNPYGYRPPYKDFIRFLLQRPFYAGYVTYAHEPPKGAASRKPIIEENLGAHPAIISRQLFDQVQDIRRSVGNNSRRQGQAQRREYPLSGVLRCGQCGGAMRGATANGGVRYYLCSNRADKHRLPDGGFCTQPMVRAEEAEAGVLAFLQGFALPSDLRPDVLAHCYLDDDVEVIDHQRNKLIAHIKRTTQLFEVGVIPWDAFQQRIAALRADITALTPEQQVDAPQAEAWLNDLASLWQAAQPHERKALAGVIFRSITVKGQALTQFELRPFLKQDNSDRRGQP